jgi:Flp pilus assembly protein TadG
VAWSWSGKVVLEQLVTGRTKIATEARKARLRVADTRGQAMVEFAFVLPVLVLMTIAAIEFGLVLKDWIQLTDTAGAAARAAATSRFQGQSIKGAASSLVTNAGYGAPGVTCAPSNACPADSDTVTVSVSKRWSVSIPLLPGLGGTMTSDATEKVE